MKDKVFVFDMDGVIVDTKKQLYSIYAQFIHSFGKEIDTADYQILDGFKIAEIVAFAQKKYALPREEKELLEEYNHQIKIIYRHVVLVKGVKKILRILKKNKFTVALASSAKREYINLVLERFKLQKYFDCIVSGDDVTKAKPSPEIYNLIRNQYGQKEYYVIEDSEQGLSAAASAKMHVIHFNQEKKNKEQTNKEQKETHSPEYSITDMAEMEKIWNEILTQCKIIALTSNIKVSLQEETTDNSQTHPEVDKHWNKVKKENPSLYNGKVLSYHAHQFEGNTLKITCSLTEYKYYLAQLAGIIKNKILPLAVSGIIIDEENCTLLAKRSDTVTEYKQHYEFVPSGGLSLEDVNENKEVDFKKRIAQELEEETPFSLLDLQEIKPFCLVLDKKDSVFDIGLIIRLRGSLRERVPFPLLVNIKEYNQPLVFSLNEVEAFFKQEKIVPTSVNLFKILERSAKGSTKGGN